MNGRALARPFCVVALMWLALLAIGCEAGDPGDGGLPDSSCLNAACDAELDTCRHNPACPPLFACLQTCAPSDSSCKSACTDQYPDGYGDALALADCSAEHCGG